MNLAQLIDPEWVREGSKARYGRAVRIEGSADPASLESRPVREVVAEEMARPARKSPKYKRRRGIEALAAMAAAIDELDRKESASASQRTIAEQLGKSQGGISYLIAAGLASKHWARSGAIMQYRYTLTPLGRSLLKDAEA